ncbi:MAG: sodium:calcium antiporter [Deltaproteobacteria bacterium]|nr:sodium:calcium antiporter [Deltaproteobacteria bacterium]
MLYTVFRFIGDESVLKGVIADLPTVALLVVIAGCILVLSKGADWMIDGVVHLSRRTGMPRIVIGATIISLGTTTPEAVVSVMAAWMGDPGLALGNGVGSIIADTGLIFGLTCIISRVPVNKYILNRTGWVQVGAATLLVVVSVLILISARGDPVLGRGVGFSFLALLGIYMYMTYLWAKRGGDLALDGEALDESELMSLPRCWLVLLVGLFMVVLGARILVPSASEIASRLGVPEDVIAATMVAFGTSVPELMTAIASVRKGHPEITVGNIVGADVLNCFFVIGAAAAARPLEIPQNFYLFHFPAMLVILYSFRFFIHKDKDGFFSKSQGTWLLGVYLVYVALQYGLNIGTVHGTG